MTCRYLFVHDETSGPSARRRGPARSAAALTLALSAVLAGCSDSGVDPLPDPPSYQGTLSPAEGWEGLAGGVVLTPLNGEGFEVLLTMEGAPEAEGGFPWLLRDGTCADPGQALGDWEEFPPIELDEAGGWGITVEVPIDDEAEGYVMDIRRSADDRETPLACADLGTDPQAS